MPRRAFAAAVLVLALMLMGSPSVADEAGHAPVDRPGPALTISSSTLAASLTCSGDPTRDSRPAVLLVHGTSVTASENWSHTYEPSLTALGFAWCAVSLPARGTGDVQISAEYVVGAIRELYRRSGRPIAVIGSSQGGMLPRWALRFWPDTRPMVEDVIGVVASNHGTTLWPAGCAPKCMPAQWQQSAGSGFMRALNSGQETFPGISYTNIYTRHDGTVEPNADDSGSTSLHGGGGRIANIAVQDVCPVDPSNHIIAGFADHIAFALAKDALTRSGPADLTSVKMAGCLQRIWPRLNLRGVVPDVVAAAITHPGSAAPIPAEPPLACYVTATC
jgi:triacylglycerol esterase/lipase EstA (alpha/beta hydrolase family)